MRRSKVRKSRIILLVVLLLILIYLIGVRFFSDRFFFNTYVDGFKVGTQKVEKVEELVSSQADNYVLELKTVDNRDQIVRAADVKLTFELNDTVLRMKKTQGAFKWVVGLFKKTEYHAVPDIKIDEKLTEEYLLSLPIFSKDAQVNPEDARIEVIDHQYSVVDEIEGNVIKKKAFLEAVKKHIYNNDAFMDLDAEGLYRKPEIYRDHESITVPMETLSAYNRSVIRYEIEGHDEIVDPEVFSHWIELDEDSLEVRINRAKVEEYVKTMARKYDTWSLEREFKTTGAGTIKIKGGTYGWLVERKAEVDRLIEDIQAGQEITREPEYRYKAMARVPNDIGSTYVEIDISRQRMWFYKEGQLVVETPVVTGRPTPSRYTPVGIYPLNYKTKDATLSGEGYSSKVRLWMPFNNNIGIHDASWRSRFGGDIYKTAGSHGCINTPYAAVQKIYEKIEKGIPVVVYNSRPYIIREPEVQKPEEEKTEDETKPEEKPEDKKKKKEDKKKKPVEEEPEDVDFIDEEEGDEE